MVRKSVLALAVLMLASVVAEAQTYVRPYVRRDGTYVQGHYRSYSDGNFYNNWSTYGNVNPYTGSYGTRRYPSYGYGSSYSYPSYSSPYRYNYGGSYGYGY